MGRAALSVPFGLATATFATTMAVAPRLVARAPTPLAAGASLALGGAGLALAGGLPQSFAALLIGFGLCFGAANGIGYGASLATANMMGVKGSAFERLPKGIATGLAVGGYVATPVFFSQLLKVRALATASSALAPLRALLARHSWRRSTGF